MSNRFVIEIANSQGVPEDNIFVRYLLRKTKAVSRDSKARRSLGNLYALYILARDYANGNKAGSRFTTLLGQMRELPYGSKLQNHPLDNRLNDEFSRQYGVNDDLLPVQPGDLPEGKSRKLSMALLQYEDGSPENIANFVVIAVEKYIELITEKQTSYLEKIQSEETNFHDFISSAFETNSDARLFEIVSYAILKEHYSNSFIYIGDTPDQLKKINWELFRAGRTNANDGGIDFILKPLGRIFQVTETLDFYKYFLDFEKVNRYPISFVIKTELTPDQALEELTKSAKKSKKFDDRHVDKYLSLFEEIITLTNLKSALNDIADSEDAISRVKRDIVEQFMLEYGMLD